MTVRAMGAHLQLYTNIAPHTHDKSFSHTLTVTNTLPKCEKACFIRVKTTDTKPNKSCRDPAMAWSDGLIKDPFLQLMREIYILEL